MKILILAFSCISLLSAQMCYEVVGVEDDDVLNMRAKQTWKSEKVGSIAPYEKSVVAMKCEGGVDFETLMNMTPIQAHKENAKNPGWCQVQYEGKIGWVSKRYLVESKCRSK